MQVGKLLKWFASAMRVAAAKIRLGSKLQLPHGGKPVYLGRGTRLIVAKGGCMKLGRGVYVDDRSRLQVSANACMSLGEGCYLNTNCRMVAAEEIAVGAHTMFGPNVCVYDHDHIFDADGVHGDLLKKPIAIGEHCWIAANSLVTRGVAIADRICVGGGSVVTCALEEPGVYAGSPARLVRSTACEGGGVNGSVAKAQENQARDHSPQSAQRVLAATNLQGQGEGA